ncbi:MAG TPA: indole-3-glycerol phosphate synthase TrpC [Acidimicrobiales bacterium]|nr:indole-3-glycerol phosphate synthase TrpC [Acidimicrobiales bacterium]
MAATYLSDILAYHRARASRDTREWRERLDDIYYRGPSLTRALRAEPSMIKVIAEVKRRSPSKGVIDEHLVAGEIASEYQRGGASAISVLTDEQYFAGSRRDLLDVHLAVDVPILRKDFTVSENDVLDTAEMGASAVLLIVAALEDRELRDFIELSRRCGLDALVEVHDELDLRRALAAGASLIGVNQRDLRTFEVDPQRAAALARTLPDEVTKVAESGIAHVGDVRRVAEAGFHAVLVGETFVRATHREALVREFASVARVSRE